MPPIRVRIPPLSIDAVQFVQSILGSPSDTIDVNELKPSQVDELLMVLEAEYQTAPTAERMKAVGEFAAMLSRARTSADPTEG